MFLVSMLNLKAVNKRPASSKAERLSISDIRFGWSTEGHRHIERTAINLLPNNSYRRFLQQNMAAINEVSALQDRNNSGPDHFVPLEQSESGGQPLRQAEDHSFGTIDKAFSANRRTGRENALGTQKASALEMAADGVPARNVFNATMGEYRRLVALLRKASGDKTASNQQQFSKALVERVGSLAHFVGDLNQPMHTSYFYNWRLATPEKRKAHKELERNVMSPLDYVNWANRLSAHPSSSLNRALHSRVVPSCVLDALQKSHIGMFTLVAADRESRTMKGQPVDYLEKLHRAWRPVMETQLSESTVLLNQLLHSAFVEAEKPVIQALPIEPSDVSVNPFLATSLHNQPEMNGALSGYRMQPNVSSFPVLPKRKAFDTLEGNVFAASGSKRMRAKL